MFLIRLITLLTGLKLFQLGPLNLLSWWWIAGLFAFIVIWFELFERWLGLDRKPQGPLQKKKGARV